MSSCMEARKKKKKKMMGCLVHFYRAASNLRQNESGIHPGSDESPTNSEAMAGPDWNIVDSEVLVLTL